MNEQSRVRRALINAIEKQADYVFNNGKELYDVLAFVGTEKEYKRQEALQEHFYAVIRNKLGRDGNLVDELTIALNLQSVYLAEAMFRRGAMEAFGLFRMFLDADDRRRASC